MKWFDLVLPHAILTPFILVCAFLYLETRHYFFFSWVMILGFLGFFVCIDQIRKLAKERKKA